MAVSPFSDAVGNGLMDISDVSVSKTGTMSEFCSAILIARNSFSYTLDSSENRISRFAGWTFTSTWSKSIVRKIMETGYRSRGRMDPYPSNTA